MWQENAAKWQENAAAHVETRRQFEAATEATRLENAATRQENLAGHVETRRYFDVVTEETRHEIRLVAESVAYVIEDLQRTRTTLDEKIDRTTAETQAMIRFSHRELDRRISSLEER